MISSLHQQCGLLSLLVDVLLCLLLLLSSQVFCFNQQHKILPPPTSPPQGVMFEEKTRLGSTPPSCHNKCNGCHPCMAVQVPTIPSHNRVKPGFYKSTTTTTEFSFDPYPSGGRYSNYKPLGWKCHCGGHFYNP